jgi:hypothetical protein
MVSSSQIQRLIADSEVYFFGDAQRGHGGNRKSETSQCAGIDDARGVPVHVLDTTAAQTSDLVCLRGAFTEADI